MRIAAALLTLLAASAAAAADLDIAFIGTLSGAKAFTAQDQLDGFRLAVRHLGGRLGGVEIALSVTDDRHDPEIARQAATSAWADPHLRVLLVSSQSNALVSLAPQAAAHRSVILNLGQAPAALAGRDCSANLFSLVLRSDTVQEMTGLYLQEQGFHRLAVFDSEPGEGALAAFRRGFKGEIVEIKSRPGSMDFAPSLARLAEAKADAAYFLHRSGMGVEFLEQYAAAHLNEQLPLFSSADILDQSFLTASAPAALDLFSVGPWSDDLDAPSNKRLIADFEQEYGRQVSAGAALGYDAAMLLDAAIRFIDRKINDVDALRAALKRVDFPSTRGGFRFDNDQFPIVTFYVRQVAADARGRLVNEQRGILTRDVHDSLAHECPLPPALPPPPPPKAAK
jgi:branched-chain amino acid transport system substrate-binding protein